VKDLVMVAKMALALAVQLELALALALVLARISEALVLEQPYLQCAYSIR